MDKNKSLIELLIELDDDSLSKIYLSFASYKWPEPLPAEMKPHWWDESRYLSDPLRHQRVYAFRLPIMEYIKSKVPREILYKYYGQY